MKRKLTAALLLMLCMLILTACGCKHEIWLDANCTDPKTCADCGETEGAPLGHSWYAATCTTAKTCEVCSHVEGEPLGHSWADATCEAPKTCSACALTEGEALGHSWQEATTDAPKTCATCGATEGERIITDPRFTTASTQEIQGVWYYDAVLTEKEMELEGVELALNVRVFLDFRNDGILAASLSVPDEEAFINALVEAYVEVMYQEFEALDLSREEADAAMQEAYGMGIRDYLATSFAEVDFDELIGTAFRASGFDEGVYYMKDGKLFTGNNWESEMVEEEYTLTQDTLVIESFNEGFGSEAVFHRQEQ